IAGLALVTYGLVSAGENGWTSPTTLGGIAGGLLLLAALGWLESRLARPLIELALFRVPAFTWGVGLAAIGVLAMVGVLFTMPQYFQAVAGTDAMGSGVRLLPLIAGLLVGALPADRLAARVGAQGDRRRRLPGAGRRAAGGGPDGRRLQP